MTTKIPDSPKGTTPADAGGPKAARKPTIAAIRSFIGAQGPCTVIVLSEYAHHFRQPRRDGNLYIVEDPNRRGTLHWTDREGNYSRVTEAGPMQVRVEAKKAQGSKKRARRVEQIADRATLLSVPDTDPLPVRLIDLKRVTLITGFSKSFIYERADFPKPAKLGNSKRDASRWSEAEVLAWVGNLLASRDDIKN